MSTTTVLTVNEYPLYLKLYARQHNLRASTVNITPLLHKAAILEYQVREQTITVYQARKRFVKQYPKSNCIPSSAKLVRVGDDTFLFSALDLLPPLQCCVSGHYKENTNARK